jgi:hypothetical protein
MEIVMLIIGALIFFAGALFMLITLQKITEVEKEPETVIEYKYIEKDSKEARKKKKDEEDEDENNFYQ